MGRLLSTDEIETLDIGEQLSYIKEYLPEMENTLESLIKKHSDKLVKDLEEIKELVIFLKTNKRQFKHPSLDISTQHGVILAPNTDKTLIYVYDGNARLKQVDVYKDHDVKTDVTCDVDAIVNSKTLNLIYEGIQEAKKELIRMAGEYMDEIDDLKKLP